MIGKNNINNRLVPFVIRTIQSKTTSQGKKAITVATFPVRQTSSKGIRQLLSSGIPLQELKYFDLIAEEEFSNGIYIFYLNNNPYYVGKCSSRAIVDRIGSHMDLRQSGVINCMVKRIAKHVLKAPSKRNLNSFTSQEIQIAALPVLNSLKMFYIPVTSGIKKLEDVENSLIAELQPTLQYSYSQTLKKRYDLITIT